MSELGRAITPYGSKLFDGPLGVVQLGFAGYNLGYTNADTILKPDADIKDIMAQQTGTKARDHTVTGTDWTLTATMTEISTELLKVVAPYFIESSGSAGNDHGFFKADQYTSLKDTIAGVLRVAPVVNQVPSEDIEDIINFYTVIPKIDGDLINWGADSQRNLPVTFMCKLRTFTSAESATVSSAYGYWGDPTLEDLPAANWLDLEAPTIDSGAVSSATEIVLTASENVTEISGVTSTQQIVINVDGLYVVPTAVVYATNTITLTLPAASIATTQVVTCSISASTFEDADNNENDIVTELSVVNSL